VRQPADYFQYAIEAHTIDGLTLENFKGSHAHQSKVQHFKGLNMSENR